MLMNKSSLKNKKCHCKPETAYGDTPYKHKQLMPDRFLFLLSSASWIPNNPKASPQGTCIKSTIPV